MNCWVLFLVKLCLGFFYVHPWLTWKHTSLYYPLLGCGVNVLSHKTSGECSPLLLLLVKIFKTIGLFSQLEYSQCKFESQTYMRNRRPVVLKMYRDVFYSEVGQELQAAFTGWWIFSCLLFLRGCNLFKGFFFSCGWDLRSNTPHCVTKNLIPCSQVGIKTHCSWLLGHRVDWHFTQDGHTANLQNYSSTSQSAEDPFPFLWIYLCI